MTTKKMNREIYKERVGYPDTHKLTVADGYVYINDIPHTILECHKAHNIPHMEAWLLKSGFADTFVVKVVVPDPLDVDFLDAFVAAREEAGIPITMAYTYSPTKEWPYKKDPSAVRVVPILHDNTKDDFSATLREELKLLRDNDIEQYLWLYSNKSIAYKSWALATQCLIEKLYPMVTKAAVFAFECDVRRLWYESDVTKDIKSSMEDAVMRKFFTAI